MADYTKCPSCSNKKSDTEIYKCRECGKTFCAQCGEDKFGDVCSKCDIACQKVGEIA